MAELPRDETVPAGLWCSQGTPCTSVFLPVALDAPLPAALTAGGGEPDPVSSWWAQKALGDAAMADPARLVPAVQRAWATWERQVEAEAARDRSGAGPRLEAPSRGHARAGPRDHGRDRGWMTMVDRQ